MLTKKAWKCNHNYKKVFNKNRTRDDAIIESNRQEFLKCNYVKECTGKSGYNKAMKYFRKAIKSIKKKQM